MMNSQTAEADKIRAQWAQGDALRDQGVIPENVRTVSDIVYTGSESAAEEKWHLTDILYPEDKKGKYPVLVSIHGGGWFYGDKELYSLYAAHMASKGFAVVNFNYRLSPEYKYPCGFEDVCRLMNFISEHASEYSLDTENLFVTGDSCGAQLAAQYCIYTLSEKYRTLFDFRLNGLPVPSAVALNCGIYDIIKEQDTMLLGWYTDGVSEHSLADMLDYMNSSFPRTYLMSSVNDGLCPRTQVMKEALEKHGISHVFRQYGFEDKNNGHVFHLNMRSEEGKTCNQEETDFFLK